MGSGRHARNRRPAQPGAATPGTNPRRPWFLRGAGAWVAGIVSGVLVVAGGAWFLDFGRSVADNSGPALAAVADVDPLSTHSYALADPVTSAADKVTLLSGTGSAAQVTRLIARHGGVPVSRMDVTLILEGRRSSLRIVNIQPQIRHEPAGRPPRAAFIQLPQAGSEPVIPVTTELGQPGSVLETKSGPYFDSEQIDLVRGERESFRISFLATTGYYEFTLLVTYVDGGHQYEQTIPGPIDGTFRLAGLAADYHDYGALYLGTSEAGNQFEVASTAQSCQLFKKSAGC
jgi:hypothetical protein